MSKMTQMSTSSKSLRRQLLITASALALLASATKPARAEDADRPVLWLELGGQLEMLGGNPEKTKPPFLTYTPRPDFEGFSPLEIETPSRYSYGFEGQLRFTPGNSDWMFSAAIRYGRAHGDRRRHAEASPGCIQRATICYTLATVAELEETAQDSEFHEILDFQAGKDVGLGIFGKSTLSAGVRFAQLRLTTGTYFNEIPSVVVINPLVFLVGHHQYVASALTQRDFRGIGPMVSWDGNAPLAGSSDDGEISLDWGINASLLFGKQKARTHHETAGIYYRSGLKYHHKIISQYHTPKDSDRKKSVTVPNLGGFAGVSFRYSDAKLSLGYRADFFFGAFDGGIDTRKSTTRSFYGPFASISIGLGN